MSKNMPASSTSRGNKRLRGSDTESAAAEVIVESTSTGAGVRKLCIICGSVVSSNIVKDAQYEAVMQIYWCTLAVDVKPEFCRKTDTCSKCFDKLVTYFETNDIIVYFESFFKLQRLQLLRATLSGIKKWNKEGVSLTKIQQDVLKQSTEEEDLFAEEEQIKQTLQGYKMDQIEMLDDDNDEESGQDGKSRKVLRLSKSEDVGGSKKKVLSLKGTPKKGNDSNEEDSD